MKKFISSLAVLSLLMEIIACNGISIVDFEAESVVSRHKTSLMIRDVNVSQNEAVGVANMFIRSNAGNMMLPTKGAFSNTKMIRSTETVREDGQDLMYVFNYEGGGFVIVGSTRNYYPILAYSDEGSFVLKDDMGPVDVWLDETKVSIKNSGSFDNETKAQMHNLWSRYDGTYVDPTQELLSARRPQTRSTGEDACWEEIETLQALYGSQGWTFLPLSFVEEIFDDAGLSNLYDDICYSAYQNHSALNETVIGYKNSPYYTSPVGPLLNTYGWHQDTPFNDYCQNNCAAGCAVIAAAQIVKYYEHISSYPMQWGGTTFYWNEINNYPDASSTTRQPHFIQYVASYIPGIDYANGDSGATAIQIKNGMQNLGYTATLQSHSQIAVNNQIFQGGKPVMMLGLDANGNGHAWVCDGGKQYIYNYMTFFTENQPYGAGTFTQGMYTINNPGTEGGIVLPYYHMKFGVQGGSYDTWYIENSFNSGCDYHYSRQDIIVTCP